MQKINWNEVYRKQSGTLIGVAYRYIRERRQAEDLVQDAFIVAIQKADRFSGKGAFEAWLRKIVVNECLMYLRKAKLKTEDLKENLQMVDDEEDLDYEDDPDKRKVIERCNFSREDLLDIATHLPEHHRLVFNMYVIDGFSHKDIAAELNISEGTSKSHLNRARKKLQNLLYEKALDMQKKKKKRLLAAVWLGALFGKTSVVDAMHLKAFADFKLLVPPPSPGLEQAILSASTASVGLSTTAIAIIAGCIGVASGIGGALGVAEWQNHRFEQINTIIEYQIDVVEDFIIPGHPVLIDIHESATQIPAQAPTQTSTPIYTPIYTEIIEEKEEKKTDIIEDTLEGYEPPVIIRRTVIIEEPIYEH
ncbi:MAG: sigma-70 family RNA polymerase sigma factor [Bacteroidales bacterium]|nr:sigma-70 family RNA polymerase sigma factor [Bacteroidales bacterium]